jgi:site-specific recombinase XerD
MTESEKFFLCIRNWLTVFLPKQRCLSANSIKSYKAALNLLIDFLRDEKRLKTDQICFSVFTKELVGEYLNWLGEKRKCGATTQNLRLAALRSFFHYAGITDISLIAVEIEMQKVPMKKEPGKMVDFLSENALRALLSVPDAKTKIGVRNLFLMIIMYDTAARCQEILDLRLKDFVLGDSQPYVYLTGKGDKQRSVPLLPKTVRHYEQYVKLFHPTPCSGEDLLFYTTIHMARHPMSPDSVAVFMKKYGEQARLTCREIPERVHPHQLRHTRAMHLYRSGWPLPLVSELLGHAKITTTNVYAYADTEMKRKALERTALSTSPAEIPRWNDDEDMILRLSGLR